MAPPILLRRQSGLFRILMTVVLCRVAVAIAALAFASTATGQELSAMGNFCVAGIRDGRTLVRRPGIAAGGDRGQRCRARGWKRLPLDKRRGWKNFRSKMTGDRACAEVLLTAERKARAARRGMWADPNFAPLRSHDAARITTVRGQFALVEGKVLSVRESGATIYLNFGRRGAQDFTVTILKRNRRAFAAAGIDPGRLEGQSIRVRAWVEERTGPMIEAVAPEQIEFVDRK